MKIRLISAPQLGLSWGLGLSLAKIIIQCRLDDVQQSEKVRIFQHEQHIKHCKKSAILKLSTDEGVLVGHEACSKFLFSQVQQLLCKPASLDLEAQKKLLAVVDPLFSEAQNQAFFNLPEKDKVKEV